MDLFQTLLFEIYFQSRRLFLGMDIIGSFNMIPPSGVLRGHLTRV